MPSFLALIINGIVSLLLPQLFCPLTLKCEISTGIFASRPILIASLIASTTLSSSYLINSVLSLKGLSITFLTL
jgi:hypothetical protein